MGLVSCDDLRRDLVVAVRRGERKKAAQIRQRAENVRCRVTSWGLGRIVVHRGARFSKRQIAAGTEIELEHTTSRRQARYIAKQHLTEDARYYTKLCKIWPREHGCRLLRAP